jgi:pyruvate dehydrogenase E2 component (dihydrolipoamide acetyltransferase)
MANEILMPRVGQSVESCVIIEWKVKEGDVVNEGDIICEVETDKATVEVESTASGTMLGIFYPVDADVPVLEIIAAVGEPGEDIEAMRPKETAPAEEETESAKVAEKTPEATQAPVQTPAAVVQNGDDVRISPRAKNLAIAKGIDYTRVGGSGPEGRIIERDILAVINGTAPLSPAAKAAMAQGGALAPLTGSGLGGRVLASDLIAPTALGGASAPAGGDFVNIRVLASDLAALIPPAPEPPAPVQPAPAETAKPARVKAQLFDFQGVHKDIKVKGIRKVVAERMHESLQTTAQLTLNASADASVLLDYRKKCKAAAESDGLGGITINDTVMFAILKTLKEFPELNAYMQDDKIIEFENIHLGFAVDTPAGLMVPVIRNADTLSLKELSKESKRLGKACIEGKIDPDDLTGGTFTVTNLGAAGIESFTPVLNAPQVGILGVCAVQLKPVMVEDEVKFLPYMGLSLTFDHCAVDGAPAARFLAALKVNIAKFAE